MPDLTTAQEHERNTELLDAELPDPRFVDARYLRWLYDENPCGAGIHDAVDEDGVRMAHYAVVPQGYRCADGAAPMVFSLNAVTRSGSQRRGWFTTLGRSLYERARQAGALGVIGVSNVNSTPPVVRKLDFRLLGPLPVRVVPPRPDPEGAVEHLPVDASLLAGPALHALATDLDRHPARGWVQAWTPDVLRWRLGAPNMASPYWVHVGAEVVAVSAVHPVARTRVAVVLKLLPRGDAPTTRRAAGLIEAVRRFHRAPVALYAGFNRLVPVHGVQPPRRLLPAPLNLIYHGVSDRAPNDTFALDTFEFLDMDAY